MDIQQQGRTGYRKRRGNNNGKSCLTCWYSHFIRLYLFSFAHIFPTFTQDFSFIHSHFSLHSILGIYYRRIFNQNSKIFTEFTSMYTCNRPRIKMPQRLFYVIYCLYPTWNLGRTIQWPKYLKIVGNKLVIEIECHTRSLTFHHFEFRQINFLSTFTAVYMLLIRALHSNTFLINKRNAETVCT